MNALTVLIEKAVYFLYNMFFFLIFIQLHTSFLLWTSFGAVRRTCIVT